MIPKASSRHKVKIATMPEPSLQNIETIEKGTEREANAGKVPVTSSRTTKSINHKRKISHGQSSSGHSKKTAPPFRSTLQHANLNEPGPSKTPVADTSKAAAGTIKTLAGNKHAPANTHTPNSGTISRPAISSKGLDEEEEDGYAGCWWCSDKDEKDYTEK